MGFPSQSGQVGFGIQTLKGTPVAATRFARLKGGSLGGNRDLLIPDPEIGGNRYIAGAYLGPIGYSGTFDFYARMEMLAMLSYGCLGNKSSTNVAGQSEVQTITITGTPTGGTFTLTYRGQTTSAIAYNATNSTVDAALEALSTIGAGNVTVTGGPGPGTPYVVTFASALAAKAIYPLTAANSLTGGTSPTITITETTPGYAPMGTHVLTPGNVLPWLTVEERVSVGYESFRYTDAQVTGLHLECDASGYFMGSVDLAALTQEANFTAQTTPAWDQSPMMVGTSVKFRVNGVLISAKSMSFDLSNNTEDDDFRLGSVSLGDLTPKRLDAGGSFTIRPTDSTLWRAATYGSTIATGPLAGAAYTVPLQIQVDSYEDIQGATTPYRCLIDVPSAVLKPFPVEPSGDDVLENTVEWVAVAPDPLVPCLTMTIRNDLANVT